MYNDLNFINRVNVNEIPEGWISIGRLLVEKIEDEIQHGNYSEEVKSEWKISAIDFNKNGRLTVSGTHINNFKEQIIEVSLYAEKTCCICGNEGFIHLTKQNVLMPLCQKHFRITNITDK